MIHQFTGEKTVDGVRYYVKFDGSLVFADQWDKMFKPVHGLKRIPSKRFKGENPDRRKNWMKDIKSY